MSAQQKRIFLALIVFFILLGIFHSKVIAQEICEPLDPLDQTKECYTTDDCLNAGMVATFCKSGQCCTTQALVKKWFEPQSFNEFQEEYYGLPEEEVSDQRFSARILNNLINTASLNIYGRTVSDQNKINYRTPSGGAVNLISDMITSLYLKPPASGVDYLANLGKNFGIPSAYAQTGIGAKGLQPILPIWNTVKNITYLFYILIFIFTGLMIMFRKKISPQAVITVENALPGIIVSLIAVTFSYAIAGFLIDLVYVLINLSFAILRFSEIVPLGEVTSLQSKFLHADFSQAIGSAFEAISSSKAGLGILAIGSAIGALVGAISGGIAFLPGAILGIGIFILVIGCVILYITFKLFFNLLSAYLSIIIKIITAPVVLMLGAIPGSKSGGIGNWITGLLSDLLIFPAVALVLILGHALLRQSLKGDLWNPPLLYIGDGVDTYLPVITSIGMLLILNKVPETVKKFFDEKYKKGPNIFAEQLGWVPNVASTVYNFGKENIPQKDFEEARYQRILTEERRKARARNEIEGHVPKQT